MTALDMQRVRAAGIARELLARSPAGSISCIFAGGSLSRGEVWAATFDGELEIYSDVDLYVVTEGSGRDEVRGAAVKVVRDLPAPMDARFLRPPDIGVYDRNELRALALRPGTIDLAQRHVLVYGDAAVLHSLRGRQPHDIPPDEALYLIENRLFELRAPGTPADAAHARLKLVCALKAFLDVHAAHMIVDRSFLPSLDERRDRFASTRPATIDETVRADLLDAYARAADLNAWLRSADPERETSSARGALARAWLALAPVVMRCAASTTVEQLVARRCDAGRRVQNARAVIRLRHRTGMPLWRSAAYAVALGRRSPRVALRVDALVRQLREDGRDDVRSGGEHDRYVAQLTAQSGMTGGSLEARVRTMHELIS